METALFLGAGASAFAGMPTTRALVNKVLHHVYHHEIWESPMAHHLAKNIVREHEDKDVEYLYQTIRDMTDAEERHRKIAEYKTREDDGAGWKREIQTSSLFHQDNVTLTDETEDVDETVKTLKSLETAIRNTLLAGLMVKRDKVKAVAELYDELFQYVPRCIITTNYDNVLETYCEQKKLDLVNGFSKTHLGYERTWNDAWSGGKDTLHLIKLHGSITWQKDEEAVLETGRPGLRDTDKDVMIAPTLGDKDYNDSIFPALWSRFEKVLAKTELLIVVGFSFRDPKINRMFRSRLTRTEKNPDPMKLLYVGIHPEDPEAGGPETDGLKRLVGLNGGPSRREVYGKCTLWHYFQDGVPHVYAYRAKFDTSTARSMKTVLEALAIEGQRGGQP